MGYDQGKAEVKLITFVYNPSCKLKSIDKGITLVKWVRFNWRGTW